MNVITRQPNFIAYSAEHQPRLVVEVKLSAHLRQNESNWLQNIRQQYGQNNCYFLFATPEQLFLWLPETNSTAMPDYTKDAEAVLAERVDMNRFPLNSLNNNQLESIIYAWLMLAQFTPAEQVQANPAQSWLIASGLHAAIYRGDLTRQAA